MTVFLTGGTGFVGGEILKQLTAAGHKVRCLVRAGAEKKLALKKGVEIVKGDVTQVESLSGKMESCEAVIHLVGIIRAFPSKGITFEKLHSEATHNVVEQAKQAGIKHFLHMSALGTRANARSTYHRTKYKAEQYVRQSGLAYTIFRPSVIFGPGDAFVNMLAKMIRLAPVVPVIGDGRYKLQPVAVENVAQGFLQALDNPLARNKIYELGGPDQLEYNQLLDVIAEAIGHKAIKIHQPVWLLKPMVGLLEDFSFFPLSCDQLIMLQEDNVCDPQPFCRELGVELTPFADGIKKWL